jgi:hypothetical protein
MVKKKQAKNITTDELAIIINRGFQSQMDYVEKKFGDIDRRFDGVVTKKEFDEVKKDVKYIKENLDDSILLGKRVDYIENILNIPAGKNN